MIWKALNLILNVLKLFPLFIASSFNKFTHLSSYICLIKPQLISAIRINRTISARKQHFNLIIHVLHISALFTQLAETFAEAPRPAGLLESGWRCMLQNRVLSWIQMNSNEIIHLGGEGGEGKMEVRSSSSTCRCFFHISHHTSANLNLDVHNFIGRSLPFWQIKHFIPFSTPPWNVLH